MEASILNQIEHASKSFQKVGVVADVSALLHGATTRSKISLQNLPGAFLHFVGESAAPATYGSRTFKQTITERYGVMVVTRSLNDAGGEKAAKVTSELVKELDSALLGFTPEGAINGMQKSASAGRLITWAKDLYFYAVYYEATKRFCKKIGA